MLHYFTGKKERKRYLRLSGTAVRELRGGGKKGTRLTGKDRGKKSATRWKRPDQLTPGLGEKEEGGEGENRTGPYEKKEGVHRGEGHDPRWSSIEKEKEEKKIFGSKA